MLKTGDRIANKYRILRKVGSGGMGIVYQAIHERLNQVVALKVLHTFHRHSKTDVARFEHEVRAMSVVNNPHIARALDADLLEDGSLYLVMEYLEGRDLRAELTRRHTIPYSEAVAYIVQACEGLACVHDAGIVHRDLKPQNLFITQLEASRVLKVLDFGLAKFLSSEAVALTTSGLTVGTPLYMSPEQLCRPDEVGTASDVWSLGVVLYELIVGISPFQADTPGAVVAAVVLEEPVPLIEVAPQVPKGLNDILCKVFVKSSAKRLSSVRELQEIIAPFGMPRDAVRVTSPSQDPQFHRKKLSSHPELSEQIRRNIDGENDSQISPAANGVRRLPVLTGIELPLAGHDSDARVALADENQMEPATVRKGTLPRGRRRLGWVAALSLVFLIGCTLAWIGKRAPSVARVQTPSAVPSVEHGPLVRETVPAVTASPPPAASNLQPAPSAKGNAPVIRSRSMRTQASSAASAGPENGTKPPRLAADGKPLHL